MCSVYTVVQHAPGSGDDGSTARQPIGVLVSGSVISDLWFADDISLPADSELDLQSPVDKLRSSSLQISGTKSEVQVIRRDTL